MVSFNGTTKVIKLGVGVTQIQAIEMYSRWKDWVIQGNANYSPAFQTVGGEPLTSGLRSPVYFFLTNGWKVEPDSNSHTLDVETNLYAEGGADPFVTPSGMYNIRVNNKTSDAQIVTVTSGSGLSQDQQNMLQGVYLALLGRRTQDPQTGRVVVFDENNTAKHTLQSLKEGSNSSLFEADEIIPVEE